MKGRPLAALAFDRGGLRPAAFDRRRAAPAAFVRSLRSLFGRGGGPDSRRCPVSGGSRPPSTRALRAGFGLVEILVVALTVGVLAAIAVPSYQKLTQRARAAALIEDLRAIGTAAYQYQVQHDEWPADVYPAIVPPELEETLAGIRFRGPGYRLDWDNWSFRSRPTVGVSVLVTNPALEAAFIAMADESRLWRVGNRYTYVIEGFY